MPRDGPKTREETDIGLENENETWDQRLEPFLRIQEPVILHEPQIKG